MSLTLFLIFFVKAFAIVMFAMNVGVILTWADRRQGAMIQDRIGPNRAVMWLPAKVVQFLAAAPAVLLAGGLLYLVSQTEAAGPERTARAMVFTQLAILWNWLTLFIIAMRVEKRGQKSSFDRFVQTLGPPRRIAIAGVALNVIPFLIAAAMRGTAEGRFFREVGYGSGPMLLSFAILFGAGYVVYNLRREKRVGLRLAGLLHPAADGLKTLFKEDIIPPNADRLLHSIAPIISFFPALVVLAVVPFGDTLCFGVDQAGQLDLWKLAPSVPAEGVCTTGAVTLQVADLNVGILYFFALAGTGIVGAALAGWASDNKYSLLGGARAASQMVSYEVTLGLTIVGVLMVYGTLRVDEMIRWQAENSWGIFVQPLAFFLFLAASVAESKRIPFDLPEGESEIVAGYFTEYSGMKFAMFFFSEYIAVVSSSALMAALFFGGWHLPFVNRAGIEIAIGGDIFFKASLSHGFVIALGVLAFVLKIVVLCWLQLTIRWTLPRFRYDQLMRLGWRKLLPASLINIMATGVVVLVIEGGGPSWTPALATAGDLSELVVAVAGAFAAVAMLVFILSSPKKRRLLVSTSARYAASLGGTRTSRMGA